MIVVTTGRYFLFHSFLSPVGDFVTIPRYTCVFSSVSLLSKAFQRKNTFAFNLRNKQKHQKAFNPNHLIFNTLNTKNKQKPKPTKPPLLRSCPSVAPTATASASTWPPQRRPRRWAPRGARGAAATAAAAWGWMG